MNYLAHIFLSYQNNDILLGNFAADFIRNKEVKKLPDSQVNGVLLHRLIDAYTDIHPDVKRSTKRLRPLQAKYAPVVSDILFDYILAKNWDMFHPVPLDTFKLEVYERLAGKVPEFPEKAQSKVSKMVAGDFIRSYQSLDGIHSVFERMDKRTSFPSRFAEATEQLRLDEDKYTEDFVKFFPMMQGKAQAFLAGLELPNTWK